MADLANGYALQRQVVSAMPTPPGINSGIDQLMESITNLHQAVSELELMLENNGLLQPAPPLDGTVATAGANGKDSRMRVSEMVRSAQAGVYAARDRVMTLRDRLDV